MSVANIFITSETRMVIFVDGSARKRTSNSENCGPPPGNNFDLNEGQRSRHGVNGKGLSQGPCMANINVLSLILQKI